MLAKCNTNNIPLFPVQQDASLLALGAAFSTWDPIGWREIKAGTSRVCLGYWVVAVVSVCSCFPFHKYFHLLLKANRGVLYTYFGKLFRRLTPMAVH